MRKCQKCIAVGLKNVDADMYCEDCEVYVCKHHSIICGEMNHELTKLMLLRGETE